MVNIFKCLQLLNLNDFSDRSDNLRSRWKAGNIIIKVKSKVNAGTIFQTIKEDDLLE